MLSMTHHLDRRTFLIAGGLTALASTRVLGANDTLRVGVIGTGGRMNDLLNAADRVGNYQVVAACDVYAPRRDTIKERSKGTATTHTDYRELLEQKLDAVIIASPDRWRWFWNFGGGAMTDLFTHWIDVAHWAMKSDQPTNAQMLADKSIFPQWDCPDTVQAAFRYPGFDVVYEGMMASSIDDGGLEFRGTEATLKINRSGFGVYHESVSGRENPVVKADSFRDGTIDHMQNFFDCVRSRKEPNAPVETGVASARAGQIANLAYHRGGSVAWPAKSSV